MRSKRAASKDDASSSTAVPAAAASQDIKSTSRLSSGALSKRAADMLANSDLSTFGEPKPDSKTLAETREGAERLASELEEFLANHETEIDNHASLPFTGPSDINKKDSSSSTTLTDEAIADLQLATARKLREVR